LLKRLLALSVKKTKRNMEGYYERYWDRLRIDMELTNSGKQIDLTYNVMAKYVGPTDALYQHGIGM